MNRWYQGYRKFLFPRETDLWLTLFRIGLGFALAVYVLSLRNDWSSLLGQSLLLPESDTARWRDWLNSLAKETFTSAVWWGLLLSGVGLVVGIFTRISAAVAWALHLCATKGAGLSGYGVDSVITIGFFYLMLSPLPGRYSIDAKLWRVRPHDPGLLGFWRRALQLHLCFIYFFGGLTKCLGNGWWNGSNLWRALIRPPFNVVRPEILLQFKHIFPIAGICICLLEITYPVLIWPQRTRLIWLACILGMHLIIGLAMGMYLFSFVMIVFNLAAYGRVPDLSVIPFIGKSRLLRFAPGRHERSPV